MLIAHHQLLQVGKPWFYPPLGEMSFGVMLYLLLNLHFKKDSDESEWK